MKIHCIKRSLIDREQNTRETINAVSVNPDETVRQLCERLLFVPPNYYQSGWPPPGHPQVRAHDVLELRAEPEGDEEIRYE